MSERDPQIKPNSAARRRAMARESQRRMVALVGAGETDWAKGALPLHKSVYIDPERFEAERTKLFLGEPIVAGLSADIRAAGDFLIFDAAGPSILATRGKDGVARAFLNMCMHRGAKLIEEVEPFSGQRARITCPFQRRAVRSGCARQFHSQRMKPSTAARRAFRLHQTSMRETGT